MINTKKLLLAIMALALSTTAYSQTMSRDLMIFYTSQWEGERFEDGRPKVPDDILQRMKKVSIEEAWGVLRGEGYHNQFEGGWKILHPEQPIVGRALTALYMPNRPDVSAPIMEKGKQEGRLGNTNSWPIDALSMGDVYVADAFGKIVDGTMIGDNLGNSIYAKSGNGVVFNSSSRDMDGLMKIEGFNAFVRDWHPSFLKEVMLAGLNVPIRMGAATVLPGDVVLAKGEGVIFIPAHLAEKVVTTAELVMLRDQFGIQRLKEGKYSPGQIDSRWTDEIERDFSQWLNDHMDELPVPKEQIQELLKSRTW
jgi:regulator of RNase E activity RraA